MIIVSKKHKRPERIEATIARATRKTPHTTGVRQVTVVIKELVKYILEHLQNGDAVQINGLGCIVLVRRKGRVTRPGAHAIHRLNLLRVHPDADYVRLRVSHRFLQQLWKVRKPVYQKVLNKSLQDIDTDLECPR